MAECIHGGDYDALKDMMEKPELAQKFGPRVWVYSEMAARNMVMEAYVRGKRESEERLGRDNG